MILYHVSVNTNHSGEFIPRIPSYVLPGEDSAIERVCTSLTIEGCLSSMPSGGVTLRKTVAKSNIFKVFKIDTEKLCIEKIYSYTDLYKDDLVMDAYISQECWIMEPFSVPEEDIFFIQIEGFTDYSHFIEGGESYLADVCEEFSHSSLSYDEFMFELEEEGRFEEACIEFVEICDLHARLIPMGKEVA